MKLATSLLCGLIIYVLLLVITVEGKLDLNKKVPAIYVFGDSTADVGNNKYLPGNNSSADSLPYGIDYPTKKPTGRFSNGYNATDHLGINEVKKACCGYGRLNVEHGCNSTSIPCDDRNHTLFWDSVHPTMKTGEVAASAFFNSPQFATPITFKKLVEDGN